MADILRPLIPYLAYLYLSLVGATSRVRWEGMEHLRAVEKGGMGFIYAFWHQRQALFTYTHRDIGAYVLVSRSRDGELIAKTMELSRIGSVRGSSSRGASEATRGLLDLLSQGRRIGITPDGPKGPTRQVKPGALFLALKSGRPILPIASAASRTIRIKRVWDQFCVPLPFSKISIVHGEPLFVRPGDDLNQKALQLKEMLDQITEQADREVSAKAG